MNCTRLLQLFSISPTSRQDKSTSNRFISFINWHIYGLETLVHPQVKTQVGIELNLLEISSENGFDLICPTL